jgi:hypothetical protein
MIASVTPLSGGITFRRYNAKNRGEADMAQTVINVPGSASVLGGHIAILDMLDEFVDGFSTTYEEILHGLADEMTDELRSEATKLDGWKDIAEFLSVTFQEDSFVYGVQAEAEAVAMTLEFGSFNQPPTGFLRKQAMQNAHDIGMDFQVAFSGELPVG